MNQIPRFKQDFSDIDHLDRATESFMKGQRKALGKRPVRAPRTAPSWMQTHWKQFSVVAAMILVCGIALFAGIHFARSRAELRQPDSESVAEAQQTSERPPQENPTPGIQPAVTPSDDGTDTAPEQSEEPPSVTTAPRTESSSSATQTAGESKTDETQPFSGRTETDAQTQSSSESQTSRSSVVTSTSPRVSLGSQGAQAVTTRTTARTTTTKATTSKTTTKTTTTLTTKATTKATTHSTTKSTTHTTVTTASTTKTVTTTAAQPKVSIISASVSGWTAYGTDQYQQTVTLTFYNDSSARYSSYKYFSVRLYGNNSSISFVGCSSGNASSITRSGDTVTFKYTEALNGYSYGTVTFTVTSNRKIPYADPV